MTPDTRSDSRDRAAAAEAAVVQRHLRGLWGLPGTALGVVGRPASWSQRLFVRWHYWWQAQLLDCLVDAYLREPSAPRAARIGAVARGIRLRNLGRWTNAYYDDMCWLALALQRARAAGVRRPDAVRTITARVLDAWCPDELGGIPWRRGDAYRNAPANGPAAILLARTGHGGRAVATADWLHDVLTDPATGLIGDGVVPGRPVDRTVYGYCQGVVLGADVELVKLGRPAGHRVHALVDAVASRLAPDGVLAGHGGGNGGLFGGILARYLALVATDLPGGDPDDVRTRATAADLVLSSARAAWGNASWSGGPAWENAAWSGGPVFGADWSRPAVLPRRGPAPVVRGADVQPSADAERDLSVQLGGWMLLEAAARVSR